MPYQPFLDVMSTPRVGIYRRVFRTQSVQETYGSLMWGQAIVAALQPLITTCEVALRNRTHVSLSRQASTHAIAEAAKFNSGIATIASEVQANPAPAIPQAPAAVTNSYPWYDSTYGWKTLSGETLSKVEEILNAKNGMRKSIQPTPDQVVAELSLGVWPNILISQLTQKEEIVTFNDVFPDHPRAKKKHWNFENARKDAAERCQDLQKLRNRISHCGPIWPEGWFKNSATQIFSEVLPRLKSRRQDLVDLLSWMCSQSAQFHCASFAAQWFDQLCTEDAVMAFMNNPQNSAGGLAIAPVDKQILLAHLKRP